jgi:hypothetical protein
VLLNGVSALEQLMQCDLFDGVGFFRRNKRCADDNAYSFPSFMINQEDNKQTADIQDTPRVLDAILTKPL